MFRRYIETAAGIAGIVAFLGVFVTGIGLTIAAIMKCGWQSLFLGDGLVWTFLFGMCG